MRASTPLVLVLAMTLAGCAGKRVPDTAAEAFKDICVDTHAAPDAVIKAIKTAGGSQSTNATVPPNQAPTTKATFWDLKIGGRPATVSQVTFLAAPVAGEPQERDESCGIVMPSGDAASVEEVRTWIANRADPPYEFYDLDARKPVDGRRDRDRARSEDKLWRLVVIDAGTAAYFNIVHERLDR